MLVTCVPCRASSCQYNTQWRSDRCLHRWALVSPTAPRTQSGLTKRSTCRSHNGSHRASRQCTKTLLHTQSTQNPLAIWSEDTLRQQASESTRMSWCIRVLQHTRLVIFPFSRISTIRANVDTNALLDIVDPFTQVQVLLLFFQ
jgi:hypothetical protein